MRDSHIGGGHPLGSHLSFDWTLITSAELTAEKRLACVPRIQPSVSKMIIEPLTKMRDVSKSPSYLLASSRPNSLDSLRYSVKKSVRDRWSGAEAVGLSAVVLLLQYKIQRVEPTTSDLYARLLALAVEAFHLHWRVSLSVAIVGRGQEVGRLLTRAGSVYPIHAPYEQPLP